MPSLSERVAAARQTETTETTANRSDALSELRGMLEESDILRLSGTFDPEQARAALIRLHGVSIVQAGTESLRLAVKGATHKLPEIFAALSQAGAEVRETTPRRPASPSP